MSVIVLIEDTAWESFADIEALGSRAANAVLAGKPCSVAVLLSNDSEIRTLNKQFRNVDKATNVLSFPSPSMPLPPGELPHLGDIVLAYETVKAEALTANKTLADHVTHLIVHGTLHLLGHDHEDDAEAEEMEQKERGILAKLGIADPYTA